MNKSTAILSCLFCLFLIFTIACGENAEATAEKAPLDNGYTQKKLETYKKDATNRLYDDFLVNAANYDLDLSDDQKAKAKDIISEEVNSSTDEFNASGTKVEDLSEKEAQKLQRDMFQAIYERVIAEVLTAQQKEYVNKVQAERKEESQN